MWAVKNQTPFAVDRNWVLDKNAAKHWVIAVKGTFDILPDGATQLSKKQEAPLLLPEYFGDAGTSSLRYELDLSASKPAVDVLLNGTAYAPPGDAVTELDVTLTVGTAIRKVLKVSGDRYWDPGLLHDALPTPAEPFESMPLTWERAFGGSDTSSEDPAMHRYESRNPVGTGFAESRKYLAGQRLPNVEFPRRRVSSWKDRPQPAGFGPVSSYWEPRLSYAGTYDAHWLEDRFPLLPQDFNERHFCCAPEDQQTPELKGGEAVELLNLSPGGRLVFSLPKVHLSFLTRFGRERVYHGCRLHTVLIESDVPRVIMVWHSSLACHHKVDQLDETLVFEKERIVYDALVPAASLTARPA